MRNNLNFAQLSMLVKNGNNQPISSFYDFPNLLDAFPSHMKQFFDYHDCSFYLPTPFLSHDFDTPTQVSSLVLDETTLGELVLLHHSVFGFSSLVYYSSGRLLETFLLHEQLYDNYSLHDYFLLLHQFGAYLLGEKSFYDLYKK